MMMYRIVLLIVSIAMCTTFGGCGGVRTVIDFVPVTDGYETTEVLADDGADGWFTSGVGSVALVDVTGLIADADGGLIGGVLGSTANPVSDFVEALRTIEDDRSIDAVIVRINSPGGTVTASDVCYRELSHFRARTGLPVVILMADVAASGGYYLACAGDHIIAHPTTITASIGVIMQMVNVNDGLTRLGIHPDSITSGPNKAMGNPFDPPNETHRAILKGIVDDMYGRFREVVIASRPWIDPSRIDEVMDGRVIMGEAAREAGLVDEIGDIHDAFAAAKTMAGLDRARLVKLHRSLEYVGSAYASSTIPDPRAAGQGGDVSLISINAAPIYRQPTAWYLWTGGS